MFFRMSLFSCTRVLFPCSSFCYRVFQPPYVVPEAFKNKLGLSWVWVPSSASCVFGSKIRACFQFLCLLVCLYMHRSSALSLSLSVSTRQVLSTILANPLQLGADSPSAHQKPLRSGGTRCQVVSGATLIVVPASLLEQWSNVRPQFWLKCGIDCIFFFRILFRIHTGRAPKDAKYEVLYFQSCSWLGSVGQGERE